MKKSKKFNKNPKNKTIKGGKCHITNENKIFRYNILEFRENIIKHWANTGWRSKINSLKNISYYDTNKQFIYHPVILNILQQDNENYKLENNNIIWCFYDGEYSFGYPDYKFIIEKINAYIKEDFYLENTIPKLMRKIFEDYPKKCNILQPSLLQIFILQFFIDSDDYTKMNELQSNYYTNKERWTSYLQLFYSENVFNNIFLNFDILGSGHDKDLDERSLLVARRCLNDININSIHTMDGHGRFITRLMKILIDNNIFLERPDFNIFVYDIDNETDIWHRITMPLGTAKKGNILIELENSINDETIQDKLFYVNFSGLTISVNNKITNEGGDKAYKSTYKSTKSRINTSKSRNNTTVITKPKNITINQGDKIMELYNKLLEIDKVDRLFVSFANVRNKKYSDKLYNDIVTFNQNVEDNNKIMLLTERSLNQNNELGDFITVGTK